ncbi:MAG: ATP-dependent helicase HrpB [Desulfuromonadaceae bacterium]|nr:ATP-dependent helicase HrpB [Desulfuromonadaceae bacterium]
MPQADLPIAPLLPHLLQTLAHQATVILQAPPGAGKTTGVPLSLLEAEWLAGKSILMLEPRRLAASNAARFMARQLNEEVGQTVGYSIRYQHVVSSATRLEVVTEGILTRRLQRDPELKGVGLVIFDEFHERHLQSDLSLALCHDVQQGLRDDLKLLVMSATLDGEPLAKLLNAPILTSEGRSFPVDIRYLPGKPQQRIVEATVRAIRRALQETEGDLLVFLPGEAEIRRCVEQLGDLAQQLLLCPLYGNLPFAEQERAIKPAGRRKIVLATNIAETSLTIEGISTVVDSGFCRQPRFASGSGLTRLELCRISQASTEQRAGRAGRLGPGTCYRLWSEGVQQALLPFTPPEISAADLSPLVLDLLNWGINRPETLSWLDPPAPSAWQSGLKLLETLGALTPKQQLTATGKTLTEIPTHPRLGRLLLEAQQTDLLGVGCDLVALLSEKDPWFNREPRPTSDSDPLDRLEEFWKQQRQQRISREFAATARAGRYWRRHFGLKTEVEPSTVDAQQVGRLLAAAFPDRIARARQPGSKRYLLASGQGAQLGGKSALKQTEFLIAVDLRALQGTEAEICLASSIDKSTLQKLTPDLPWEKQGYWDADEGRVVACEKQMLGALTINQRPIKLEQELISAAVLDAVRTEGLQLLDWTKKTRNFIARVNFLHRQIPSDEWPDFSDNSLLETLEDWLLPFLGTARNRHELRRIDLFSALHSQLDWQQRQQLERLAPERLQVPSGSQIRLQYPSEGVPVLAVKLQEMFGQRDTPRIVGGQVAVIIHLLSPAGRPLQITQDLQHFWKESYPEVQKEMRGRYPKHPWPDNPLAALPTAKTKRKLALQKDKK